MIAGARSVAPGFDDCADPSSACYPSFWRRLGIEPGEFVVKNEPACDKLAESLGLSRQVAGEMVLLTAIAGLQSFLTERAKQEASDYAIAQLSGAVCKSPDASSSEAERLVASALQRTCAVLTADDFRLEESKLRKLQAALISDLGQLPATVLAKWQAQHPALTPTQQGLAIVATSGLSVMGEVIAGGVQPKAIPVRWVAADKAAYAKWATRVTCSVTRGELDPSCLAFAAPEVGVSLSTLDFAGSQLTAQNVAAAIEGAAGRFCATYGPVGERKDGACLLGPKFRPLLAAFSRFAQASQKFVVLQRSADNLARQGSPPGEIATRLLPDLAVAFDAWTSALEQGMPKLNKDTQRALAMTTIALRASAAAVNRDYPGMLSVVSDAFAKDGPLAEVKIPPAATEALSFAARLAAAKDSDEAKMAIEDVAAPLGTYKVKYGREGWTIALNSFVGPFAGYGRRFERKDGSPAGGLVTRPLSAPIGIDLTFASWKHHHLGFLFSVIDPFAAGTVDSDTQASKFDWGAVLTSGVFLRWGIGGSPFTLLGGVTGQPLARSPGDCTNGSNETVACWKGAFQAGAALAVDVPFLVLH